MITYAARLSAPLQLPGLQGGASVPQVMAFAGALECAGILGDPSGPVAVPPRSSRGQQPTLKGPMQAPSPFEGTLCDPQRLSQALSQGKISHPWGSNSGYPPLGGGEMSSGSARPGMALIPI